jgi:thiosulfate/3-mercaptopyruvate sulfurtransferase
MNFTTLISVEGLAQFLNNPEWVVIDCRFWLEDTEKGRLDYLESHIPGSFYAHLDEDLSGLKIPGVTGRHPLPEIDDLVKRFGAWGIGNHTQVVAYDDRGGMIAARLWWLFNWLGHEKIAVLDGGFQAWVAEGNSVSAEIPNATPNIFNPDIKPNLLVTAEDILRNFGDPGYQVVDSRASDRYRGEIEPIDPVAGRIPGAINYFWGENLNSDGHFRAKDVLRGRFATLFESVPANYVTFYCGSGVSSAHNVLAVAHSGMGLAKLYIGSWSHWITDPDRPVTTGR